MPIDTLLSQRITGIQPFNELPIDADVWREAHGQHHAHRALHAAWVHRPGIVYGLEAIRSTASDREIVVAPGVAIDEGGGPSCWRSRFASRPRRRGRRTSC